MSKGHEPFFPIPVDRHHDGEYMGGGEPGANRRFWLEGMILSGLCANPAIINDVMVGGLHDGTNTGEYIISATRALAAKALEDGDG